MADGRHFENRYIAISQWNFVHGSRFWTGWTSRDQKWKGCIGQTPSSTKRISSSSSSSSSSSYYYYYYYYNSLPSTSNPSAKLFHSGSSTKCQPVTQSTVAVLIHSALLMSLYAQLWQKTTYFIIIARRPSRGIAQRRIIRQTCNLNITPNSR